MYFNLFFIAAISFVVRITLAIMNVDFLSYETIFLIFLSAYLLHEIKLLQEQIYFNNRRNSEEELDWERDFKLNDPEDRF